MCFSLIGTHLLQTVVITVHLKLQFSSLETACNFGRFWLISRITLIWYCHAYCSIVVNNYNFINTARFSKCWVLLCGHFTPGFVIITKNIPLDARKRTTATIGWNPWRWHDPRSTVLRALFINDTCTRTKKIPPIKYASLSIMESARKNHCFTGGRTKY